MQNRIYNWKPSRNDHRDFKYNRHVGIEHTLPDHVDRIGMQVEIYDQGNVGSCTANSSTAAISIVTGVHNLSRLMAYYDGRLLEHNTSNDDGAEIRDVIRGYQKYGCADESVWPYVESNFSVKPPQAAYDDGKKLLGLIDSYESIPDLNAMKHALSLGLPVIFGFQVPEKFESDEVAQTGWLDKPDMRNRFIGGHAVLGVGYDDRDADNPFVWVRNSWNKNWALDGYFKMHQDWFTSPYGLVSDMWIVHPKK
jgi:C1A family cysteine protease